jgi:hypothetical protein
VTEGANELRRLGDAPGSAAPDLVATAPADRPLVAAAYSSAEMLWVNTFRVIRTLVLGAPETMTDAALADWFGQQCRRELMRTGPE